MIVIVKVKVIQATLVKVIIQVTGKSGSDGNTGNSGKRGSEVI